MQCEIARADYVLTQIFNAKKKISYRHNDFNWSIIFLQKWVKFLNRSL